jgi:hypothetical protein
LANLREGLSADRQKPEQSIGEVCSNLGSLYELKKGVKVAYKALFAGLRVKTTC